MHAAFHELQTINVALNRAVVPLERQPCLNCCAVLTKFAHEGAPFRHPAVESHRKPLIQRVAVPLAKYLQKPLHEQLCVRQVRMDLADTQECLGFLLRPLLGAFQEQADGAVGSQFNGRRKRGRQLSLSLQVA